MGDTGDDPGAEDQILKTQGCKGRAETGLTGLLRQVTDMQVLLGAQGQAGGTSRYSGFSRHGRTPGEGV